MQLFSCGLRPLKSALEKNLAELTKLGLDLQDMQLQVASINMAVEYDILLKSEKSSHKVSSRLSILETLIEALNYTLEHLMICMEEGIWVSSNIKIWTFILNWLDVSYGIPQIQDSVFAAYIKRYIVDDYKKQLPNLVTAFKTVSFLIKRVFM